MSWCKGSVAQFATFSQVVFMMEQHQRPSKSITEMALRHDHFHVRFVDVALDPFPHLHLYNR